MDGKGGIGGPGFIPTAGLFLENTRAFGGGGGGGGNNTDGATAGGTGGGGAGAWAFDNNPAGLASPNSGGGGGGGRGGLGFRSAGGNGASGIVVLRIDANTPEPPPTTPTTPPTTIAVPEVTKAGKVDSLPETGNNSSTLARFGILLAITGFALANQRRIFQ
jgi:hypothetical protein